MAEPFADQVRTRAGGICEYCHLPGIHPAPVEVGQIIPRQHGGKTVLGNLAWACLYCNRHKGPNLAGIDRQTSPTKLVPLFQPRRHKWGHHFRLDGPRIVGRTPVGRVTVEILNMNAPLRLALREQLIAAGLFPAG
jgi:hypothetical protein